MKFDVLVSEAGSFSDPTLLNQYYAELGIKDIDSSLRRTAVFFNGGWELFLNLPLNPRALVIDGGIGSSALALSRLMAEVDAFFPDPELARVASERVLGAKLDNVRVFTGALSERFPFEDGLFDVVALVGLGDETRLSGEFPFIMKEAHRLLKRDGVFSVIGRSGQVCPKIPRLILSGYSFPECLVIMEEPSRLPYEIRSCFSAAPLIDRLKNGLRFLFRKRHVAIHSLKRGAWHCPSIIEKILHSLPSSSKKKGLSGRLHFGSFEIYGLQTEEHVLRMPTNDYGFIRCRTNKRALQDLAKFSQVFEVPQFVQEGVVEGQCYFAETKITGNTVSYRGLSNAARASIFTSAQRCLLDLHRSTRKQVILDGDRFDALFSRPLNDLAALLGPDAQRSVDRILPLLKKNLLGKTTDLVMTHGDYKVTNFLLNEDLSIRGVIDWDLSVTEGLPLTDLFLCRSFDRFVQEKTDIYRAVYETGFEKLEEFAAMIDPAFNEYIENGVGLLPSAMATFTGYCLNHPSPQLKMNKEWLTGVSACFAKSCEKIWQTFQKEN